MIKEPIVSENIKDYSDNPDEAINGLYTFIYNFCLDEKASKEKGEPFTRCDECSFADFDTCRVKRFLNEYKDRNKEEKAIKEPDENNGTIKKFSLDNTGVLRQLLNDHPELPVIIFTGDTDYCSDMGFYFTKVSSIKVEELAKHEGHYFNRKYMLESLIYDLEIEHMNDSASADEIEKEAEERLDTIKFTKCIVIYVDVDD